MAEDDPTKDEPQGEREDKSRISGTPSINHHALAIGGAHHAYKGGHIDMATRDKIIASARKAMADQKAKKDGFRERMKTANEKEPSRFGALMPVRTTMPTSQE